MILIPERIVEVEWEDSFSRFGWQEESDLPRMPSLCRSLGYVYEDSERGMGVCESVSDRPPTAQEDHGYGHSTFIPRGAIRKVTELSRKRYSRVPAARQNRVG
ncbi:hypothetical protein LCGC14_1228150 [marine sediment metagenome]|uniref:Uncharacterized protein n=1 Tax=marine sediment metagenome TaxID=412755 RepID=A0A0F9LWG5_9ZZZZ